MRDIKLRVLMVVIGLGLPLLLLLLHANPVIALPITVVMGILFYEQTRQAKKPTKK
jgi:hypothetical protein